MSENANTDDDLLLFADETPEPDAQNSQTLAQWQILVVDDDQHVHAATRLALSGVTIFGRPLDILSAYSSAEARAMIAENENIAVVFLDVVMESEDAGLRLVQTIRDELHRHDIRIILRTGQPGYAPEIDVIRDYDINDYRNKGDLTLAKLYTALTTAIRSYDQIRSLQTTQRGLKLIIDASAEFPAFKGLRDFSEGVITQIAGLLRLPVEGIFCIKANNDDTLLEPVIIAAAGKFRRLVSHPITEIESQVVKDSVIRAFKSRQSDFSEVGVALFITGRHPPDLVAYVETSKPLEPIGQQLLEVFSSNISAGYENLELMMRLHEAAYYDAATGLPNLLKLTEHISGLVADADISKKVLALADIDHFSEINDVFGFAYGDKLAQSVGLRISQQFAHADLIARISVDTFAIVGAEDYVEPRQLPALFEEPFHIGEDSFRATTTLGLIRFDECQGGSNDYLKMANIALKRAKQKQRGGYCYYHPSMEADTRERVLLLRELRSAIGEGGLFMMYQPQINLSTGEILGVEALLRWRKADGMLIPPVQFIGLAENAGLMGEIGDWVIKQSLNEMLELRSRLGLDLRVAVNISVTQLSRPGFVDSFHRILESTGFPPHYVDAEITESVAMDSPEFMVDIINKIKRIGVAVAVDDFGTGFSSLSYLQDLNIDQLKIDRSFVEQMVGGKAGRRIVDMIIQLGKTLDLTVLAEGVGTIEQEQLLRQLGCHQAQGYYYARPMLPDDLFDWINNWRPRRVEPEKSLLK